MAINFNMLCSFMKDQICYYLNSTCIVLMKRSWMALPLRESKFNSSPHSKIISEQVEDMSGETLNTTGEWADIFLDYHTHVNMRNLTQFRTQAHDSHYVFCISWVIHSSGPWFIRPNLYSVYTLRSSPMGNISTNREILFSSFEPLWYGIKATFPRVWDF